MYYRKFLWLILLICINSYANRVLAASENVPTWLSQAAASKAPVYDREVPAVVLHNEQIITLNTDGQLIITTNYAIRMLNREGKNFADATAVYIQSSSKVREIRAWMIRPSGTVKSYEKDSIIDQISDPDDIYNEYRIKIINGESDAEPGAVFGYQTVTEEHPLFTQDIWTFQNRLPTLLSRYTLNLPSGWQASSTTFNSPDIKPSVSGTSYTWELHDLAPIPPEPDSPNVRNLAPRVDINYSPVSATANTRNFSNWQEVSVWGTELHSPSAQLDDNIAAKTRELTANAKTELDKIRAIANFVQNLQYIAIDIGIGRGNGYRPRPASLVLQRGYGDCKDKANLMRTMLSAVKIESYPVFIYSGDPTFVRAEWASPYQFNHCIIAVKVSPETNVPTIITDEKLGRLLIFDATDESTLVGDFPDHEQGSFALVVAGNDGKLMQMPILSPDNSRLERFAEANLMPDGSLNGSIHEHAFGQTAAGFRRESRALSAAQYKTVMEGWLTHRVSGAKLSKLTPKDLRGDGRFDLDLDFAADSYAQLMQGRLMIFKPAFVGRLDSLTVSDGKRVHSVLLNASAYSESIKVKLPDGFVVDELPEASKIETSFGKYNVTYEVKDGFLLFNRALTINKTEVAADKYDTIKSFFAKIRTVEGDPVVLLKK